MHKEGSVSLRVCASRRCCGAQAVGLHVDQFSSLQFVQIEVTQNSKRVPYISLVSSTECRLHLRMPISLCP